MIWLFILGLLALLVVAFVVHCWRSDDTSGWYDAELSAAAIKEGME
jgi:hypothetical protein